MAATFTLEFLHLAILIVLLAAGWLAFGLRIYDDWQWVPERGKIKTCRKKGLDLLAIVHPGTGKTILFPGKKKRKDDVKFQTPGFGVQVDPDFSGHSEPMRLQKGLNLHIYPSTHPTPVSVKNMAALTQLVGKVRERWPSVNFLSDEEVIALVNKPRDFLDHDCQVYQEKYSPLGPDGEAMTTDELITAITDIQDKLSTEPVEFDKPLLIPTALKLTPSAFLSQFLQQMEAYIRQQEQRRLMDDMKIWLYVGFGAGVMIICSVIGYNMLK